MWGSQLPTKGLLVGRRVKVVADLCTVRAEPNRFLDVVQDHPFLRRMECLVDAALNVSERLVDGVCSCRYVISRRIHVLHRPQDVWADRSEEHTSELQSL